ncbi:MAG: hypothetical protein R3B45_04020 [Bdellovibrionota bacterium]
MNLGIGLLLFKVCYHFDLFRGRLNFGALVDSYSLKREGWAEVERLIHLHQY